jgi:hypothetical protein
LGQVAEGLAEEASGNACAWRSVAGQEFRCASANTFRPCSQNQQFFAEPNASGRCQNSDCFCLQARSRPQALAVVWIVRFNCHLTIFRPPTRISPRFVALRSNGADSLGLEMQWRDLRQVRCSAFGMACRSVGGVKATLSCAISSVRICGTRAKLKSSPQMNADKRRSPRARGIRRAGGAIQGMSWRHEQNVAGTRKLSVPIQQEKL